MPEVAIQLRVRLLDEDGEPVPRIPAALEQAIAGWYMEQAEAVERTYRCYGLRVVDAVCTVEGKHADVELVVDIGTTDDEDLHEVASALADPDDDMSSPLPCGRYVSGKVRSVTID